MGKTALPLRSVHQTLSRDQRRPQTAEEEAYNLGQRWGQVTPLKRRSRSCLVTKEASVFWASKAYLPWKLETA